MYGDDLFYLKFSSSYSLPTVKVKYVCCVSEYAVLSKAKKGTGLPCLCPGNLDQDQIDVLTGVKSIGK